MIDTHAHLNFKRFSKNVDEVIAEVRKTVDVVIIPGTDITSSVRAVELATQQPGFLFAAVGIHPHHVFQYMEAPAERRVELVAEDIAHLEQLLQKNSGAIVAVGEIGLDRHQYQDTKYGNYAVNEELMELQKELVKQQIELGIRHNMPIIFHNREAGEEMLALLTSIESPKLEGRAVFHCCEPDDSLLAFAKKHHFFWGVDGDVTYTPEKQQFLPQVPLDQLVLETDAPFLLPEPLRSQKQYPNTPVHLQLIAEYVSGLYNIPMEELIRRTDKNARKLFRLPEQKS